MYGPNALPFRRYIEVNGSANEEMVGSRFSKELEAVSENLDLQHRVANHFVPLLLRGVYANQGVVQLIFNSFQSNLLHLAGVLQLMRLGYLVLLCQTEPSRCWWLSRVGRKLWRATRRPWFSADESGDHRCASA